MADVKWTKDQQIAIDNRSRTMLLSAAAGSGKTAVLTQRVIEAITDKEHPLDLSRLLAVTFTKAAASQMKEKIGNALANAIKEDPHNLNLKYQLQILPFSTIKTIDSFCGIILKKYAGIAGVSENYRTMDEAEAKILESDVMFEIIENAYTGILPSVSHLEIEQLSTHLVGIRGQEELPDILLTLYRNLNTTKEGISLLLDFENKFKEEAEKPLLNSQYYLLWKQSVNKTLQIALNRFEKYLNEVVYVQYPAFQQPQRYFPYIFDICKDASQSYEKEALETLKKSFPVITKYKEEQKATNEDSCLKKAKTLFNKVKDAIGSKISVIGSYSEDDFKAFYLESAKSCHILYSLLSSYEKEFNDICLQKNALTFSQVSRYCLNLLLKNGEKTPQAKSIAQEYDMICVDEYQDVNPLQHALFEAIASPTNRFLVGDIKQSIYMFRYADPEIFATLRKLLPDISLVGDGFSPVSHTMSNNFRSDKMVVDYANSLFSFLFGIAGDSIGYIEEKDNLVFTSKNPQNNPQKTEIYYLQNIQSVEESPELEQEDEKESSGEEESLDTIEKEAEFIAYRINKLLHDSKEKRTDGARSFSPSDIAILRRSLKGATIPFGIALQKYGILLENKEGKSFFADPEVLLAVAFLNTISNPRKDIYLTATLCSPLFGFTSDDLLAIRQGCSREESLYDALKKYIKANPEFQKGINFLSVLNRYKKLCENIPVWKLLEHIYKETPLLAIAGLDGEGGENNLKLLYTYARDYQGSEFSGLFGFLNFINQESENSEESFSAPGKVKSGEAVQLMTIHKSKGLEFPVVILSGCCKDFNTLSKNDKIYIDKELGIAHDFYAKETDRGIKNPLKAVFWDKKHQNEIEEELRILYVAVTRAMERLIIVGVSKSKYESIINKLELFSYYPNKDALFALKNYLDWILLAYYKNPTFVELSINPDYPSDIEKQEEIHDTFDKTAYQSRISEIFEETYPHEMATKLSNKYSVSELSHLLMPEKETEEKKQYQKNIRLPRAYSKETKASAAERGTATHKFLEFCDFHQLKSNGLQKELERQVNLGIFTKESVSLLRLDELELFSHSALLDQLCRARKIEREFRFSTFSAIKDIFQSEEYKTVADEKIFIQGVIDLLIENPDGTFTLVDYKTDRLTQEEIKDKSLAKAKLLSAHIDQVSFYAKAVESIYGNKPKDIYLYSLPLADTIEIEKSIWI